MSEAVEIWRDASVGEVREAMLVGGRAVALNVMRASDEGNRARWGEVYAARVRAVDLRRRGAFLDLGLRATQAFLPLGEDGRARIGRERVGLAEGAGVAARVVREAARGKSAVVELCELGYNGVAPHLLSRAECDEELTRAKAGDATVRSALDAIFEDALALTAPLPGGGLLSIEPTAALVAIDVDAGARSGSADPERFALELNIAAAEEAARQVRLRNLGGLIAVDFVAMRQKSHLAQLDRAMRGAFALDPWSVQFGGLSKFHVYEVSRAQLRTPLHEMMRGPDGRPTPETLALAALRAIEREARAQTGRQIACAVAPPVKAWLDSAVIDWRAELSNRIGMRWSIESARPGAGDKIEVWAL